MSLSKLPPETLTQILNTLAEVDLLTLMTSQAVCRQFRDIAQVILSRPTADADSNPAQLAIHPVLETKFSSLLDSNNCFEHDPNSKSRPHLKDDIDRPFQTLSWAQTDAKRAPYLRPEASWRRLRLTKGRHTITRLDLCKILTVYGGTSMKYFQLELPPSGLTMGILYDFLLSSKATFDSQTRRWRLLAGKHLISYDEWWKVRGRSSYPSENAIMEVFANNQDHPHSAVLLVEGLRGCTGPWGHKPREDGVWYPESIGKETLECFPWQGCQPGVRKPRS